MSEQQKPHISPSRVRMHDFCPQQEHFRYEQGLIMPPGVAMIKGGGVHEAAETNYKQKIGSRVDMPEADVVDLAVSGFEVRLRSEGVALNEEEESRGRSVVLGEAKDSTAQLARNLHSRVLPLVQPAVVEETVRIVLADQDFDLLGRLDVVDENETILDLKTGGRHKPQGEADTSLQLTWYGTAYRQKTGREPKGYAIDSLTEGKDPHKRLLTTRTGRDVQNMLDRINVMMTMKKAGILKAAPLGHVLCSPRFCGYWNICPWVNSERKAAAENGGA